MDTTKRNRIIYWVLTILLMVPGAGGGLVELFTSGPESIVKTMQLLGYPLYLMKIGSMPFCVELDNLKDTDAPIHQPAAMLVAAD